MRSLPLHFLVLIAIWVSPADAAPRWCQGAVSNSWTRSDGSLLILGAWRNDQTQICNILTDWKGSPATVRLSRQAKLDAAVAMPRPVTVYYNDKVADCDTLPTYHQAPAPDYVLLT